MIPSYWKEFVEVNDLIESDFDLTEDEDLSGLGAEFSLMRYEHIIEEVESAYPGIVVRADGYVPVGICLIGSGDPYFINVNEGKGGSLYRIYHDAISDNGYDHDTAIDKVLESYESLLKN